MQAEGVDYQRLPRECFFWKKFSCAEDCAESLQVKLQRWKITFVLLPNDHYNRCQQL